MDRVTRRGGPPECLSRCGPPAALDADRRVDGETEWYEAFSRSISVYQSKRGHYSDGTRTIAATNVCAGDEGLAETGPGS